MQRGFAPRGSAILNYVFLLPERSTAETHLKAAYFQPCSFQSLVLFIHWDSKLRIM